jgi:molybdopterin molybdotransferase
LNPTSAKMAEHRSHASPARARVDDALAWIDAHAGVLKAEDVPIAEGADRILARAELADLDLPPFDRAAVDGIAVRAQETVGASTYDPCVLQFTTPAGDLAPGGTCRINAGEILPRGADAIVRLEQVGADAEGRAILTEPIVAGSGVERKGSQGAPGSALAAAGQRLRPADIALFACAGLGRVAVVRKPRVRCLLADGTIPPGNSISHSQCYDANRPLLRALIERDAGIVLEQRTVPRDPTSLRHALTLPGADLILVVGGTGCGSNDHAARALMDAGDIANHGVALRHAETAGMGVVAGVPVFLLPGAPVACLLAYELFAGRAVRRLGGHTPALPFPSRSMTTARKIVSEIGLTELRPVRCLSDGSAEPTAFFAEAGLRALTEADGFVLIPEKSEGYPQGATVTVYLYSRHDRAQPQ